MTYPYSRVNEHPDLFSVIMIAVTKLSLLCLVFYSLPNSSESVTHWIYDNSNELIIPLVSKLTSFA